MLKVNKNLFSVHVVPSMGRCNFWFTFVGNFSTRFMIGSTRFENTGEDITMMAGGVQVPLVQWFNGFPYQIAHKMFSFKSVVGETTRKFE